MAMFVSEQSGTRWEQNEFHHWPHLDIARVCALSGCFDLGFAMLTYPLWHLKTREQVTTGPNALQAARVIVQHRGVLGLYRGACFGVVGLLPAHSASLCTYEWSKFWLGTRLPHSVVPALAAVFAEVAYTSLATPVEVVTVRVQSAELSAPALAPGGTIAELQSLWRAGGVQRLYRGGLLTLAASLPEAAIWWLVYENGKAVLQQRTGFGTPACCPCAAVLASLSATVLINPLDVLKTQAQAGQALQWQLQRLCACRGTLQRMFTRGLGPRLALAAVAGLPEAGTYEVVMQYGKTP
mmetsp:Transcript_9486/g.29405  ORF Transcript_9486/g.29405 Transcript_9486/m.29405 type:complete len:296 (-) Transcript_9486:36-923(-)